MTLYLKKKIYINIKLESAVWNIYIFKKSVYVFVERKKREEKELEIEDDDDDDEDENYSTLNRFFDLNSKHTCTRTNEYDFILYDAYL